MLGIVVASARSRSVLVMIKSWPRRTLITCTALPAASSDRSFDRRRELNHLAGLCGRPSARPGSSGGRSAGAGRRRPIPAEPRPAPVVFPSTGEAPARLRSGRTRQPAPSAVEGSAAAVERLRSDPAARRVRVLRRRRTRGAPVSNGTAPTASRRAFRLPRPPSTESGAPRTGDAASAQRRRASTSCSAPSPSAMRRANVTTRSGPPRGRRPRAGRATPSKDLRGRRDRRSRRHNTPNLPRRPPANPPRSSNPASSTAWPIRCTPTARSRPSFRTAR
jgi:hypothetical protein